MISVNISNISVFIASLEIRTLFEYTFFHLFNILSPSPQIYSFLLLFFLHECEYCGDSSLHSLSFLSPSAHNVHFRTLYGSFILLFKILAFCVILIHAFRPVTELQNRRMAADADISLKLHLV
jgi:hypothetical protein